MSPTQSLCYWNKILPDSSVPLSLGQQTEQNELVIQTPRGLPQT